MSVTPIAQRIAELQAQIAALQAHQPPTVTFRATARKGQPLKWDFTATAKLADGATVDSVHWDFGPSSSFDSSSLAAPGYVWTTPGVKTVRVAVTDSWGATGKAGAKVTVTAPPSYPATRTFPAKGTYPH